MSKNEERLEKLIGFDVSKKLNATGKLFESVVAEIQEKREEEAKESARATLTKAIDLRMSMSKARKEFDKQEARFEKELGKLLNRLEAGVNNRDPEPEDQPAE